ncbi:MAG: SDR family oxidoreductase [Solirubrobacterales bacterium]
MAQRRAALITGVGRAAGIGAAVARRLADSHDLVLSGYPAYDAAAGVDGEREVEAVVSELHEAGAKASQIAADLAEPDAPRQLVAAARRSLGGLDTLVAAHAHSTLTSLGSLDAGEVDRHLTVNVRATLLLVEAFAAAHDRSRGQGRIVLFSSGQRLGPMPLELAYAASKGALEALVISLAGELAPAGIAINALNPGPTDTGLRSGYAYEEIRSRFPNGRWGTPVDAARTVAWLASDEAGWITGQTIDAEGGFRR